MACSYVRPELADEQAVVILMDAVGTLKELKAGMYCLHRLRPAACCGVHLSLLMQRLAATDQKSELRFRSRALLPGMAKRLREVSMPTSCSAPTRVQSCSG